MSARSNEQQVIIHFAIDVIVEPDEDEFHAFCPALKGLHVGGRTEEEAARNAADAAIAYLESLMKHGEPIPIAVVVQSLPAGQAHAGALTHTQRLAVPVA